MKNSINYYYGLLIDKIIKNDEEYIFYYNNHEYHLIPYYRPYEEIKYLYELNINMIKQNILVHKMIKNINNSIVTFINNKSYVLIELCNYKSDKININDIKYYQNFTKNINYNKELLRTNWFDLWCKKIDYYEYQISELKNKYKLLNESIYYYIGLGENAISYLKNNYINKKEEVIVSHRRININEGSYDFYNPINFIIDFKTRDISEYIKSSFFYDNTSINEIKTYLNSINLNKNDYVLLFSRLLFPSYYFDVYDEIINNNLNEDKILNIIEKNSLYQEFLRNIYIFIRKEKNILIEPIDWL